MNKYRSVFIPQHDQSDCGVACLLTVIRFYNGYNTLENLRRLSGTDKKGTTMLGLIQAANQSGLTANGYEADIQLLRQQKGPCILHVTLHNHLQHYIVYLGSDPKNTQKALIADPAQGILSIGFAELSNIWKSKACITLSPNEHFIKLTQIKRIKRSWFFHLLQQDITFLLTAAILGVLIAVLSLSMSIFSQKLIDEILPDKLSTKMFAGISFVFLILIAKEGLNVLRSILLLRQSKEFNIRIVGNFYRRLLHLPKAFFDTRTTGDLTARLHDTTRIQKVISMLAGSTLLDCLVVVITTVFIFKFYWPAGIFALLSLIFFYLCVNFNNKRIVDKQRSVMVKYAIAEGNFISTLHAAEPISTYNKQNYFADHNNILYQHYQEQLFLLGKIQRNITFWVNSFASFLMCLLLAMLCMQVMKGNLKTGELMAILGMFTSLLPSVTNLALLSIPLNEAKIAFERMFEFSLLEEEKHNSGNSQINSFHSLEIKKLSFRYPGRPAILQNITLSVNIGEIIAIMGENGSGKSTLVQIIQRHYQNNNGSVIINGEIPLSAIQLAHWRSMYAIVPQNIHIFNSTIIENIAFDDAVTNPDSVIEFLKHCGFYSYFEKLPQSCHTLIGEEGINLSGGQRQLIALARALYHKPQLLILDEATAAMDRNCELFVLELLQKIKKQIAVIFITHRLQALKKISTRIYILENGTITAQGNHLELSKSKNLYSSYWHDIIDSDLA